MHEKKPETDIRDLSFADRLRRKIRIDRLAESATASVAPVDGSARLDKAAARSLLGLGPFSKETIRDLEIYRFTNDPPPPRLLVLDNECPIYQTTIEDVALRKSPTLKEMISIRNAKKILSDQDVKLFRKEASIEAVKRACLSVIDPNFTGEDIRALSAEGREALTLGDTDGVLDVLDLFRELLRLSAPPNAFTPTGVTAWGRIARNDRNETTFGPAVLFDPLENRLMYIDNSVASTDAAAVEAFHRIAAGREKADATQSDVFDRLEGWVSAIAVKQIPMETQSPPSK